VHREVPPQAKATTLPSPSAASTPERARDAGIPAAAQQTGLLPRLDTRDVTLLLVSQAPLAKLQACRRRTGPGYLSQSRAVSVFTLVGGAVDPKPDSRLECGRWTADPHVYASSARA
jgi:Bacterial protein of unknown function (DUF899)